MKVNYVKWVCKSCSKPCFAETEDNLNDYGRPKCCLMGYTIHKWEYDEDYGFIVKDV